MLGMPPLDLLQRGSRTKEFFAEDGMLSIVHTIAAVANIFQDRGKLTLPSRRQLVSP